MLARKDQPGQGSPGVKMLTRELDDLGARYIRQLRQDLATLPVQGAELRVLVTLYETGPLSGTKLAETLEISRAAVSILGKRLLARHLVQTRTSRRDRRSRYWALTAAGQTVLDRYEHRRAERFKDAWIGMSLEERRMFLGLVRRWAREAAQAPHSESAAVSPESIG